jgi:hypothetical protein
VLTTPGVAAVAAGASPDAPHPRGALAADTRVRDILDGAALAALFDPAHCLGATDAFIARVLARHAT